MSANAKFSRELQVLSTLPIRDAWDVAGMPIQFSFERLAGPLLPLSAEPFVGVNARPEEWSRAFAFGEMSVDGGGSPFYCLSEDSPGIYTFDIESSATLEPLNTTPEAFVQSYSIARAAAFGTIDIASAARALRDTDPKTYDVENDWNLLIKQLEAGSEDA